MAVPDLCGPLAPLNVRLYTCSDFPVFDKLDEYIESQRNRSWRSHGFKSDCPIPPLLLACHESFKAASRAYTRTFSSLGSLPQTYFNYALDTLFVDWESCPGSVLEIESLLRSFAFRDEFSKIERLAIHNEILLEFYMAYGEILCDILALFGNV